MPKTTFQPSIHGFHFSNNDITWSFWPASGRQLCGGMSFACLDYFYYGLTIPPTTLAPEEGTPLHNYILRRQIVAHEYAIPRLMFADTRWAEDPFAASLRVDQHFGMVKDWIDEGRPIPILLSSATDSVSTSSHWVVAIGYEMEPSSSGQVATCSKIYVYDNNQPNVERELYPDAQGRQVLRLSHSRGNYGFYAPFAGYAAMRPTHEVMCVPPSYAELFSNPIRMPGIQLD